MKPAEGPDEQRHDRSPPGVADDDDTRNFSVSVAGAFCHSCVSLCDISFMFG